MPNFVKIGIRVWAGRTPSLPQFWFYPLFFVCVFRHIDAGQIKLQLTHYRNVFGTQYAYYRQY